MTIHSTDERAPVISRHSAVIASPIDTLWRLHSDGITGIHAWTFSPVDGGVRVDTEESWSGDPVTADVAGMQAALDASLSAWLDHLRVAAE